MVNLGSGILFLLGKSNRVRHVDIAEGARAILLEVYLGLAHIIGALPLLLDNCILHHSLLPDTTNKSVFNHVIVLNVIKINVAFLVK